MDFYSAIILLGAAAWAVCLAIVVLPFIFYYVLPSMFYYTFWGVVLIGEAVYHGAQNFVAQHFIFPIDKTYQFPTPPDPVVVYYDDPFPPLRLSRLVC